jgi:hypothetical protein
VGGELGVALELDPLSVAVAPSVSFGVVVVVEVIADVVEVVAAALSAGSMPARMRTARTTKTASTASAVLTASQLMRGCRRLTAPTLPARPEPAPNRP